jgi:DNA polymerase V
MKKSIKKAKKIINPPLFLMSVPAGFPSPADDFVESRLDLNDYLIDKPAATYFLRVNGQSMINLSINDGDLLIVDRAIEPKNDHVVVASIDGEFTVKVFEKTKDKIKLMPANPHFRPIFINQEDDFMIWGVVKHVIHTLQKCKTR